MSRRDPSGGMAGRQTDDMRRIGPDISNPGPGGRLECIGVEPLRCQDRPLVVWTTQRVLADRTVRPNHAVAWDDQRDGVVTERRSDRADGLRASDLGGQPAVRPNLATGDLQRLVPDVPFERGVAAQVQIDPDTAIAAEPPSDGASENGSGSARRRTLVAPSVPGATTRNRRRPRRPPRRRRRHRSRPRTTARSANRTERTRRPARGLTARRPTGRLVPSRAIRPTRMRSACRWSCAHLLALACLGSLVRPSQQRQASMDLGLDRPFRPLQCRGEIGIGQTIDMTEHHRAPIGRWQRQQKRGPATGRVSVRHDGQRPTSVVHPGLEAARQWLVERQWWPAPTGAATQS